jgi:hypothetical protein
VFEDIDVYDSVELACFQALQCTAHDFVSTMGVVVPKIQGQLSSEKRIRLETDPPSIPTPIEVWRIGADSSADLKDIAGNEGPDAA